MVRRVEPDVLKWMCETGMNRAWHRAHPMPKSLTKEERLKWHLEHAKECGCREIPESLRKGSR